MHGLGQREYIMWVADTFQKFHDCQEEDIRIPPVSHFQWAPELVFAIKLYNIYQTGWTVVNY